MQKSDWIEIIAEIFFVIGYAFIVALIYHVCISDGMWGGEDILFSVIMGGIYNPFVASKLRRYVTPKLIKFLK